MFRIDIVKRLKRITRSFTLIRLIKITYFSSSQAHIQATGVTTKNTCGKLSIAALYCPPSFSIKVENFCQFYRTFGNKCMPAGDYNAKHTIWGSRLISTKDQEIYKTKMELKLSPGIPTTNPSDQSKISII